MRLYEAVWICRCGNGQIVFVRRVDDGHVIAICEECTKTYVDVGEDGRVVRGGLGYDLDVTYATRAEIEARGWVEYIRGWVSLD